MVTHSRSQEGEGAAHAVAATMAEALHPDEGIGQFFHVAATKLTLFRQTSNREREIIHLTQLSKVKVEVKMEVKKEVKREVIKGQYQNIHIYYNVRAEYEPFYEYIVNGPLIFTQKVLHIEIKVVTLRST